MTYTSLHTKIRLLWGRAKECEFCHVQKTKRYEWSNKPHTYKIRRSSWQQLCKKCHLAYDRRRFGFIVWNKGRKGRQKNHNISGLVAGWNKGIKGKADVICVCGTKFYPPKHTSRFCSKSCAMRGNKRANSLNRTRNL